MSVEFHGNWTGSGKAHIDVDEKTYLVKKATFDKFNYCTNAKEVVEAIEYFAYIEIVKKGLENNEFFEVVKE